MNKTPLVCLLGGLSLGLLAGCHSRSSAPPTGPTAPVPHTIAAASTAPSALSAPTMASAPSTLSSPKIGAPLAAMARRVQAASTGSAAKALSNRRAHIDAAGRIQVYVHVSSFGDTVSQSLQQAGAKMDRGVASMSVYQVWASPAALARIAKLPTVTRITLPAYGFPK
ncbi:MAG: hypothetical protein ACRETC_02950 [Gammaproteobacteria bacterium]